MNAITVESGLPHLNNKPNGRSEKVENLRFVKASEFIAEHPEPTEPIIEGLCRRGETMNLIGSTKEGKSWLILGMSLSVADGRPWLGRKTTHGVVAMVDNELRVGTLSSRIQCVAKLMSIEDTVLNQNVRILSLRGRQRSLPELREAIFELKEESVSLLALDAFYRFLSDGSSELDFARMTDAYNVIDEYAEILGAAVAVNHHSTKGDQSSKSVTDVGSGAGAISRAVDTHVVLRPHEIESCAVMEAACRSFPPQQPVTVQWVFPLWTLKDAIAPSLKSRIGSREAKQKAANEEADTEVLELLKDGKRIVNVGSWIEFLSDEHDLKAPSNDYSKKKRLKSEVGAQGNKERKLHFSTEFTTKTTKCAREMCTVVFACTGHMRKLCVHAP